MSKQFLIVGLGNPGQKYQNNRHNVGKLFVSFLKQELSNPNLLLSQSTCFMNESGKFVQKEVNKHQLANANLFIVHDDLDIPLGKFKIQFGRGPKVHNGIASIEDAIGKSEFWRIRIGIDNRSQDYKIAGEKYVLDDFTTEELTVINTTFGEITKDLMTKIK